MISGIDHCAVFIRLTLLFGVLAAMVHAGCACADDTGAGADVRAADSASQLHIRADNMKYDMKRGISNYSGNVLVTHAGMQLSGDTVTMTQQGDELESIVVNGTPARYRQLTGNDESINAESLKMTYSTRENLLTLSEKARLEQAGHIVESQRIIYDTVREVVIAGQQSPQDRVNITLTPKKQSPDSDTRTTGTPPETRDGQ